jgi:hypothetical protein
MNRSNSIDRMQYKKSKKETQNSGRLLSLKGHKSSLSQTNDLRFAMQRCGSGYKKFVSCLKFTKILIKIIWKYFIVKKASNIV